MKTNLFRARLTYIMLVVFLLLCIGFIMPMNYVPQKTAEALSLEPTSASDSMNFQNPFGLYYSINSCYEQVVDNISEKLVAENNANPDKITITNCSSTCVSMFDVPNISQAELNASYEATHGRAITGTCTLVALEEIIEATAALCDEQYVFPDTREERFARIVETFEKCSANDYTAISADDLFPITYSSGTNVNSMFIYIRDVVAPYYYDFGLAFDFWGGTTGYDRENKLNYCMSIANLDAEEVLPLSLINVYTYDRKGAHTLAIAGAYRITIKYKYKTKSGWNWLFSKSGSEDYTVFVVCNGWHTDDRGNFYVNGNYQFLVLDYDSSFTMIGFNWYDLVSGVDF